MPLSISSYSHFLETLPDAVLLVNKSGKIAWANSPASAMFGYEPDELQGQSVQILVPEIKRETHADHIASFLSNPKRRMMGTVMELAGRRKDGNEFPVDIMLSPMEMDGSQIIACAVRDVVQIKHMQDARIDMFHLLEAVPDDLFRDSVECNWLALQAYQGDSHGSIFKNGMKASIPLFQCIDSALGRLSF